MIFIAEKRHLYTYLTKIRQALNGDREVSLNIESTEYEGVSSARFNGAFLSKVTVYFYPNLINSEPIWNALHSYKVELNKKQLSLFCLIVALLGWYFLF
jgi:hypothetical protein